MFHLFNINVPSEFPGSPFSCKVIGAGQATISGHNLKMGAVKRLMSFTVDPQTPSTNCDVIATPPSAIALPITIEPIDGKYNVSFVPTEVGRHNISVLVDGESIKGSPFACNIYDVTKVSSELRDYNVLNVFNIKLNAVMIPGARVRSHRGVAWSGDHVYR